MNYFEGKSKDTLLADLRGTAEVGSPIHEQLKMAIIVRSAEGVENAIHGFTEQLKKNALSSDKLAAKVFWLNVILTFATTTGAIATLIMAVGG